MPLRRLAIGLLVGLLLSACALQARPSAPDNPERALACRAVSFEGAEFTVCRFDATTDDIRMFHSGADGRLHGQFGRLADALARRGEHLAFAMNGGMYHADRTPVGLYIEAGMTHRPMVRGDGPGNFQLLPNGVFWIAGGAAGVTETNAYAEAGREPVYATQSGPMLVIDGELHPAFLEDSDSLYRRNGVGVGEDARTVHFAISEQPVNLHHFARLFRDGLGVRNALYLDGKVSRLYAPALDRHDYGFAMGPIIGVVEPAGAREE